MSANKLTKSILQYLNASGFVAWNVYNGAVYDPKIKQYRKNKAKKLGVFDICGFRKSDGKHIEVEVKWGRDKMSIHQKLHLDDLQKSGALCYIANHFDEFVEWIESTK